MKRFRYLVPAAAMVSISPSPVSAQTSIALLGGAARSWWVHEHPVVVYDGPSESVLPLVRSSIGVSATVPFRNWFAIQFGSAYSRKGAREIFSWGWGGSWYEARREIEYLEIALLGKLALPLDKLAHGPLADLPLKPHFLWGFFAASPVSCRVGTVDSPGDGGAGSWSDCVPPSRPPEGDSPADGGLDGGVVVGGGLDVRLTELNEKLGVTVSLLYGHSLGSRYWGRIRTATLRGGLVYHTR